MDIKSMVHTAMGVFSTMLQGAPPPRRDQFPKNTVGSAPIEPWMQGDHNQVGGGDAKSGLKLD